MNSHNICNHIGTQNFIMYMYNPFFVQNQIHEFQPIIFTGVVDVLIH